MLCALPAASLETLNGACAAVGIISDERTRKASACFLRAQHMLYEGEEARFIQAAEVQESVWEAVSFKGIVRRDFWPTTGRRRRTYISSSFLKWSCISPKEFMTRVQDRQLGLYQSEYEVLTCLCDEIACVDQPITVRVQRHRYRPGFCLFLRITTTRSFDVCGRLVRMEHVCEPLSIQELDEVLERDPGIVQVAYMGSGSSYAKKGG